ncbi:MAG: hypothetical protein ACRDS0_25020 [Pseudonocardiaceae bacterium]
MAIELESGTLVPVAASIGGTILWDDESEDDPFLGHAIRVDFEPLPGREGEAHPQLHVHSIRLPVRSWRQLQGRSFTFPNVVRKIYADGEEVPILDIHGSLRLGSDYHNAQVSEIRFGERTGCRIGVAVTGELVIGKQAPIPFGLEVPVELSPVRVTGDVATGEFPDLQQAAELAGRLLTTADYREPEVVDGCVEYSPDYGPAQGAE